MSAPKEDTPGRQVRVTLRCLQEDLGTPVPEDTVDLGELDHPLLAEARRLAPTAPQGQRRIEAIAPPPLVFRLRHGQWRGAAWVDQETQPTQIFWLVGAALRKAGDRDDAFEHFSRLHVTGTLLPSPDDKVRLRLEAAARTLDRWTADLGKLLKVADRSPEVEHAGVLGDFVSATIYKRVCDGYDEYWLALKVQVSGGPMPVRLERCYRICPRAVVKARTAPEACLAARSMSSGLVSTLAGTCSDWLAPAITETTDGRASRPPIVKPRRSVPSCRAEAKSPPRCRSWPR